MMTISITDTSYSNRYYGRTQSNKSQEQEDSLAAEKSNYSRDLDRSIEQEEENERLLEYRSTALAAALWEMELAKAAKASEMVGTVDADQLEVEQASYGTGVLPAEIMRKHILQSMGLTEGDLADMLPNERASLENRIESAIQQQRFMQQ